jgi:uncharacterized membrane-anchored protein YhcB (DUF1043 family)
MTNKDLIITANLLAANMGDQTTKTQKKLKKIYDKIKPLIDSYQEQIEGIRLDNASVDDKGNLITDEKSGYKFTKDAAKKVNQQLKELNEKEIEFKPIEVLNPDGLEIHVYLQGWLTGVEFKQDEESVDL